MSVTASIAVLITLFPPIALSDVRISALWQRQFPADPRPTTGERLDALEWIDGNQIILLGTEDGDALAERLQAHGLDTNTYKHAYPLRYRPNGFDVLLPQVPAAASTTVHFIVAINAYPEPAEDSAWFAADVPHQRVLAELAS
ncbi:hypothetical protein DYQ95_00680 [Xanthomonas sp. LMG 9002]|nr:hypothetical protein [Xanthomonas sp. LMG 9002]